MPELKEGNFASILVLATSPFLCEQSHRVQKYFGVVIKLTAINFDNKLTASTATIRLCLVLHTNEAVIFTVITCILILSSLLFIQLNSQPECSIKMLKINVNVSFNSFLERSGCAFSWINKKKVKVKQSRYRPAGAQRVPRS